MERVSETLVSRKEIEAAVTRLAKEISEDYKGKDLIVVGILKGAAVFLADLIRKIDCPMIMDFMQVSSYYNGTVSSGNVKIKKDLDYDISGKDVLIVEDIIDSGVTMQCLKRELFSRNPNSIRVVAAFDKPSRRTVDFRADYIGIEVPDKFIVGYGLDYAGKYRNLPDVCVLEVDGGDK
ncbi:MAG: hypoxanthine phosphoribosyltransferase [Clostridiales bacterium]|jgi:hypoxanthine phosphoribosyltransferase|nr:hypoxanthine phosphoribosyltransferase [Clostridiales bacterium]